MRDVLSRCRRHKFFSEACGRDAELRKLAASIDSGVGSVSLIPGAGMENTVAQVRHPDGEIVWQDIVGTTRITLPAGENEVMLGSGVNLRFSVIPGGSGQVKIPPPPDNADEAVIPEDDFQLEIPGIGRFLCTMEAFVITRRPLPGKFDHESAARMLQNGRFASWRLPRRQELMKAFSPGSDGEPEFYGVRSCREPILLQSGEFFDPGSGTAVRNVPGNAGRLYPVRELSDGMPK